MFISVNKTFEKCNTISFYTRLCINAQCDKSQCDIQHWPISTKQKYPTEESQIYPISFECFSPIHYFWSMDRTDIISAMNQWSGFGLCINVQCIDTHRYILCRPMLTNIAQHVGGSPQLLGNEILRSRLRVYVFKPATCNPLGSELGKAY